MKYKYNNEWKEMNVKVSDTLPIGSVVEYDGEVVPSGWEEVGETTYNLTFNSDYIYNTDLSYICVKIGNVVILNIYTLGFKSADYAEINEVLISGLPKPIAPIPFSMYGSVEAEGDTGRFKLNDNGQITSWYWNISQYGSSANKQYGTTLVYLTND